MPLRPRRFPFSSPYVLPLLLGALLFLPARRLPADEPPPELLPYGATPKALVPYVGEGEPARRFFREPPAFRGPAHDVDASAAGPVRIGVIAPEAGADGALGQRMRHGLTLALEEANAGGGYAPGRPFALVQRDENDTWGAAGNALVDLMRGEGVVAVVGALEDSQSHVMTRLLLKLEVSMVNTAGPDPTLTEHNIPWLVRVRPDDRQTGYALAKRIFEQDRRERVVVFRSNDRYGRTGVRELVDAARRLHHPILLEQRFPAREEDLSRQIESLKSVNPDALVLWGRAEQTGRALKALRALGLSVPVYGPDRLVDPDFLAAAGASAEGITVAYPFNPSREDAPWTAFRTRFRQRFGADPDATAAYAYDGLAYLVAAVRKVGPSRTAVRDALFAPATYAGVSGLLTFDVNHNNIAPVVLGKVERGAFRFDAR